MKLFRAAVFLLISAVSLGNTALYALDGAKGPVAAAYSKEQVARQNIFTLFGWFEDGKPEKSETGKMIAVIKAQLKVLKKECALVKVSCPQVYGYLDNNFINTFVKSYNIKADNRPLLNRLFTEAAEKVEPNKDLPEVMAKHPWLDIKNSLVDCLTNEVIISFPGKAGTDLTKPELFAAPDVDTIASLVETTLTSILKTKLNITDNYRLVHGGSTSRGTSLDNTDFDYQLSFDNQVGFDLFSSNMSSILKALSNEWIRQGYKIFSVDFDRNIKTAKLISFMLRDKNGIVFRIHLSADKKMRIYADILNVQIEQIKALGGKWENVAGQIILFKRLARDVLHSYGKSYGVDGMICEQFIVQVASSSDYGQKITSIGSFDKTMRWIYSIGFDRASSTIVPLEKVASHLVMYRHSTERPLFISSPLLWEKLVNASRRYVALEKTEMSEDEFSSLGL